MLHQLSIGSLVLACAAFAIFAVYLEVFAAVTKEDLNWRGPLIWVLIPTFLSAVILICGLVLTGCGIFYLITFVTTF